MNTLNIRKNIETSIASVLKKNIAISNIKWNMHQSYKGVYLKHIIDGSITNNKISIHLVKVEPECKIENHIHKGKLEIHEVLEGNGNCIVENKKIEYYPGKINIIQENINHMVKAGKDTLYLLAVFTPSLI